MKTNCRTVSVSRSYIRVKRAWPQKSKDCVKLTKNLLHAHCAVVIIALLTSQDVQSVPAFPLKINYWEGRKKQMQVNSSHLIPTVPSALPNRSATFTRHALLLTPPQQYIISTPLFQKKKKNHDNSYRQGRIFV
ncbi:hypothetical protein CDAR_173681 [Caerostris darwini]|uniref:Uncharacterized protein n=1 Tax=Caerostris darwini TaxID=1538125 RepID=A0AAV4WHL9_9ARAC|nr:hypothetical protein CDAR_173591 [Caerostris darwini]GIY82344.1 hypothetical protein CDAR_173681 [Caerostris darwini]